MVGFLVLALLSYYFSNAAEAQAAQRCDQDICHVKITTNGLEPRTLIVKIGTKVVWTNMDDKRHTVTSGSPGEITAPLKSFLLDKGDVYEFTFHHSGLYKGSYKYFDQVTQTMRGEIIVEPELEEEAAEEGPEHMTVDVDYNDPESGVKKISLSSGRIIDMWVDVDFHTLMMELEDVQILGKMEITLDRDLIDSRTDGSDDHFLVFIDGTEAFYEELSSTPTERTLEIVVPAKAGLIEIVGTHSIPEFPVAILAVAAIFTAMIAVYRYRAGLAKYSI
jgi:plastocyanin